MTDTTHAAPGGTAVRTSLLLGAWDLAQRVLAAVMLVVFSPVIGVCAAAVAWTSPGPVFFVQERPGWRGGRLRVIKLRTMRVGADRDPRNQLAVTGAHPEVTRVGRVLRALKLDELPQLWAVVTGEMSLVGPRPIGDVLDAHLRARLPDFHRRYDVRPGLTSLGQVCSMENFPTDLLIEDWSFRSACELHYVRHRSVRYDFVVLTMTAILLARKTVEAGVSALRNRMTPQQSNPGRDRSANPGPVAALSRP